MVPHISRNIAMLAAVMVMTCNNKTNARHIIPLSADSIISDLQHFLPGFMEENHIPGCAVALIQDNRIAWSGGFGVKNSITSDPVERGTVFEVASNSKIIAAYLSLRLVDNKMLSLDKPLNAYLSEPWLPDADYRDSITLRHVLSHSSGLGHNERGRELLFPPGSGYYYSNLGFTYLQAVIEEITGKSLEEAAGEYVFDPLGMVNTSYVNPKEFRGQLANGHVRGSYILKISGVILLVSLILIWLPGMILHRIIRKSWGLRRSLLRGGFILTFLVWTLLVFTLFGVVGWVKYAWQVVISGIIFLMAFMLMYHAGRFIAGRLLQPGPGLRRALMPGWGLAVTAGLIMISSGIQHVPVPRWPSIRPMAPASLRTTAPDMAVFLLELADPKFLGDPVAALITEPQIELYPRVSWGLGTGILHGQDGDALWQWGQNVDFQSLTIIYPDRGYGAVVLTNSDWSQPDVAIEIACRILKQNMEPLLRASHLEFNSQPDHP